MVSLEAARRLENDDPAFAARWEHRCVVYGRLVHASRDVGAMFGNGGPASGQGSVAAARMQKLAPDGPNNAPRARRLERTSAGIDERVCNVVEHGVREHVCFLRVVVPGMSNYKGDLVRVMRPTYLPITSPVRSELLATCAP